MAAMAGPGQAALGQNKLMPAAPAGRNESGAPFFVILGEDALGLDTAPTDLHLLPDGRILVVAPQRLAFGDGTRWETVRENRNGLALPGCAVDRSGQIYFGAQGGFGRAVFDANGRWHVEFAARWPADERSDRNVPLRAVEAGGDWYWHSDSGSIIAWRPGKAAKTVGRTESVSHIFQFRGVPYVSDASTGSLLRLQGGSVETVFAPGTMSLKDAITSALPWDGDQELVGTVGRGVELFNGKTLTPFRTEGVLASGATVNDLCLTAGGLYVAAVENFGLICFDRNGRTVQTLDRSLDHRLAHVKRLLQTPGGTIFGIVDQGLLEVEFPSRVTSMEPLMETGVTIPAVRRFQGDLWVYSAERLLRGVYDKDNRLVRLALDTPAGSDVSSFSVVGDRLVAGTDHGGFYRTPAGWECFAPEARDLRVLSAAPVHGRWLYGAQGELGWLRATAAGFEVERIPAPAMERVHSSYTDKEGRIWLEIGVGRVARVVLHDGTPTLRIFTSRDGLPDGWVAPFEIDGVVRFNGTNQWLRFDDSAQRFVPDVGFAQLLAGLDYSGGRPARDGLGRLWVTARSEPQVLDDRGAGPPRNLHERFPAGLRPWTYFPETGGVVWMVTYHKLVRYDPAIPEEPAPPLHALITRITLLESNRTLPAAAVLPPLDYSDNSIAVQFVAPGHPIAAPVTFDVKLEGSGAGWSPVGGSGSVVFNHLNEGRYVLHILPRTGGTRGAEATLAFTIRPPWFRTPLAWVSYGVLALGLFSFAVWLLGYLRRRETLRLEKLVAERTASLRESEARLHLEFEMMPAGCIVWGPDRSVEKWNPAAERIFGYSPSEAAGRRAEGLIAPPATGDGFWPSIADENPHSHSTCENVTKSGKKIWCEWTHAPLKNSDGAILGIMSMVEDISGHRALEDQLRQAQKMEVIGKLAGGVAHDFNNILTAMTLIVGELADVPPPNSPHIDELKKLTDRAAKLTQQLLVFARKQVMRFTTLDLNVAVGEVMKMLGRLLGEQVAVRLDWSKNAMWVEADAGMLDQMVMNLCLNARDAMPEGGVLTVATSLVEFDGNNIAAHPEARAGTFACLRITDSGVGMGPDILPHVFEPFFTTKDVGLGTGLGLASVYGIIHQHQGWVEVESAPGKGTTFRAYLPIAKEPAGKTPASTKTAHGYRGTETILLVEDEEPVRKLAKMMLERLGYRVMTATDGLAAIPLWRVHGAEIELLLTDMVMPNGMTGIQLGEMFQKSRPALKIVVMSGYSEDMLGDSSKSGLKVSFLAKPFQVETIAKAIRQSLDGNLGGSTD